MIWRVVCWCVVALGVGAGFGAISSCGNTPSDEERMETFILINQPHDLTAEVMPHISDVVCDQFDHIIICNYTDGEVEARAKYDVKDPSKPVLMEVIAK